MSENQNKEYKTVVNGSLGKNYECDCVICAHYKSGRVFENVENDNIQDNLLEFREVVSKSFPSGYLVE